MRNFQVKRYRIMSDRLDNYVNICFLSDWHASLNSLSPDFLLELLQEENPDAVLLGGDMVTAQHFLSLKLADRFIRKLADRWPVYYVKGNHEAKLYQYVSSHKKYMEYKQRLERAGVVFLNNSHASLNTKGQSIEIYGVNIPLAYYRKTFPPSLTETWMERALGKPDEERFCVLLAHTPLYADRYFEWGASLTLCGHYHGGVLRFDEHHGLLSPQLELFPRYCCGAHKRDGRVLITSAGIGEHGLMTGGFLDNIKMRYHNPRELIMVLLEPSAEV